MVCLFSGNIGMKYVKRPVEIEAIQFNSEDDFEKIDKWMKDNGGEASLVRHKQHKGSRITIPTLEGVMNANLGDWIIKGVNNEFYPCKPDIFKKTYIKAEEYERNNIDKIRSDEE